MQIRNWTEARMSAALRAFIYLVLLILNQAPLTFFLLNFSTIALMHLCVCCRRVKSALLTKAAAACVLCSVVTMCPLCASGERCQSFIDLAPASEKGECPLVIVVKRSN